ncbi:hypothetical protein PNEG_02586 [Pneumocystis murina B123]|uniref:Uncharacterized protein n=1 Tax=Pneumocystis murina (strain B123) TaxID=1069680 RepID=M7NPT2_PNEMU|nr:hypothetical protein PNEG_02586 [Pneumocystis murina B123]EMR09252.1 hypothetical protein PNEG_02586 [Pneumocystis murina B123]
MIFFLFLFYYQVRGNLEKIIFTASPSLPTLQTTVSVFENLLPQQHLEQQVQLGFYPNNSAILIERWYFIHSLHINHTYEIRLSWPATSPALIYFDVFQISNSIIYSINSSLNFYLRVRLIPDYFSLYPTVMASHPLSFHLFLDQVILGLPYTLRWTLAYASIVGFIAWFGIAPLLYKLICWQIKKKSI